MKSTRMAEAALSIGAAFLFGAAIVIARQWPAETALFPVLLAGIGLLLALVALVGDFLRDPAAGTAGQHSGEKTGVHDEEHAPQHVTFLWIGGFFASVMLAGFAWGLPVMALAYYRYEARLSWLASALAALACWAFLYLSIGFLNLELYDGAIVGLLG